MHYDNNIPHPVLGDGGELSVDSSIDSLTTGNESENPAPPRPHPRRRSIFTINRLFYRRQGKKKARACAPSPEELKTS